MPVTAEQATTELRRRRATEELVRRKQPDFGMIAIPREKLPGVWEYDKQLESLLGDDRNLDDFLPLDVKYDFGRIIGMTEKPDETKDKMATSLFYSVELGIPPRTTFNMLDELNKIAFDETIPASTAWGRIKQRYRTGKAQVQLMNLGYDILNGTWQDWEKYENSLKNIEKLQSGMTIDQRKEFRGFFEKLVGASAELVPFGLEAAKEFPAGAAIGGTIFGIGAALATAAIPTLGEEAVIAPAIITGMKIGAGIKGAIKVGELEAGGMFLELAQMKDQYGNKIDPRIAVVASAAVGTINGGIELVEWQLLLGTFGLSKKLFDKSVRKVTHRLFTQGTLKELIARKMLDYSIALSAETLQEIEQETTTIVFGELAKELNNARKGTDFKPITAEALTTRYREVTVESMRAFGLMVLPGTTISGALELVAQKKAATEIATKEVEKIEVKAPVSAEKKTEAIEFVKNILSQEQFSALDEKARTEIGQRMLAEQGVEVEAAELAVKPPTEAIVAPEKPVAGRKAEIAPTAKAEGITRKEAQTNALKEIKESQKTIFEKYNKQINEAETQSEKFKLAQKRDAEIEKATTKIADKWEKQIAPVTQPEAVVADMTLDALKKESAIFDKKIETEKARLDKISPERQRFGDAGITYLSQEDVARYTEINYEIARRTGISQAEAKKRVAEKRAARLAKPEKPIQKAIKIEKEIIPKQSKESFTPPVVQKETKAEVPEADSETQNAVNLMEGYWREYDERELEINVAATKNQEAITKALDKKLYLPESDIETSKMSQTMMLYIDLKEHPSGRQFAEELSKLQKEIYELSKSLPAKIQRIADSIIQQNREAGKLAIDKEIISVARENYIAHLWEKPTRQESLRARFRTTTARAKARTLEGGIMEGWAKGKQLRVKDVTLATQIAQSQINQAIVGREMLKLGKKWGLLSYKQPEGWVRVEHPGFTTWKWSGKAEKAKTYGRNFFVTEEGDLMERVPVYAEPELGKKLNNVFSPSALYKVPGIKTISRYNAQIKTTILFTSLYHHQAYLRSYAFGSRGLNPKKAYEVGRQAIMNMTPEVRLLVRNGLTIGRIQDYDPRMIEGEQTIWGRALSHTKLTEVIRKKLVDLRKRQERFLFNRLGPALKIQAGLLELKAELKRNQAELESGEITVDEIAAAVANLMNNDFGGLHLGRMGRSQTAQHIFRLLALAPDWTESNIRSAVDAFRKGETGYLHRMFWGRIAVKGLGATILFNLLLSTFDDDDFAERYKKAWETGRLRWLDIDITPIFEALGGSDDKRKYFSLIGHFRDPVKFTVHPFISAKHKGSVVSRIMLDMMIGQDWAGRQFTTIGELTGITEDGKNSGRLVRYSRSGAKPIEPSQVPSYALYQVRSAMPIPMQNLIAFLGGEMDAFDAISKSMGLMTATTYPKRIPKVSKIKRD